VKQYLQWNAIVLAAALSALSADALAAASPRWTPIGPPAGPMSAHLVLDPISGSRAYAITAAGLLRTQNGGRIWGSVQNGLDGQPLAVTVDPAHPGRVYASVLSLDYRTSLRRSDDYGDHWTVLYSPSGTFLGTPQTLEVDPSSPSTLYWLRNKLLFRSQNAGKTWSCIPVGQFCSGPTFVPLMAFALSPVRPETLYAQDDTAFYTSLDAGATWSRSVLTLNPPALAGSSKSLLRAEPWIFPTSIPHQLYVQAGNVSTFCFLRSDDDGTTWHAYQGHSLCGNPAVDPADPETIRLAITTNSGPQLWVSHDGGESGSFVGSLPAFGDLYDFAEGGFLLATDQGLFRAAAEAGPWLPANRGFSASAISFLLPTPEGLLAVPTLPDDLAAALPALPLLSTADDGRSWITQPLIDAEKIAVDPRDPLHLIASSSRFESWSTVHHRVLESRDGGQTWRGVVAPQLEIPLFVSLAIDPYDSRTFYGGAIDGFYRSRDGGLTWQRSNAGLPINTECDEHFCASNYVRTILPDPRVAGRLTVRFEYEVYGSVDGGAHWSFRSPVKASLGVDLLARGPGDALLAVGGGDRPADQTRIGVFYRSTDEGRTWTRGGRLPSGAGLPGTIAFTGLVANEGGVFVGTNLLGVLWSRNGGNSWSPLNDGLPTPAVNGLAADPSDPKRVYAIVPQNGVYAVEVP
jgi:photosystem II stability/assembly factor-like uncharacterized protein